MTRMMIEAEDVGKRFGPVTALAGVDLSVPQGSVLCLLGHNGAGKTTLVNILATLLAPGSGTARVAGHDVVTEGREVRRRIGLTGQFASVDDKISGRANLVLLARLLGAGRRAARLRAGELLELLDLEDAGGRPVHTYSGGMRRRLDLAAGLVGRPEVLFLDEPTAGLDPLGRGTLWNVLREMARDGATVLLTTQDLQEADALADTITMLARGEIVATGTPARLKALVGTRTVAVTLPAAELAAAERALSGAGLRPLAGGPASGRRAGRVTVPATAEDTALVLRALDRAGVRILDLAIGEPGLDQVFAAFAAEDAGPARADAARRPIGGAE